MDLTHSTHDELDDLEAAVRDERISVVTEEALENGLQDQRGDSYVAGDEVEHRGKRRTS